MFYAEKRMKLSDESGINKNKKKNNSSAADSSEHGVESGFHSPGDFTNKTGDFSLPPVKRKCCTSRHVSFQSSKQSFDLVDPHQSSLGYSSLLASPCSPRKSRGLTHSSPRKRKQETDENDFCNSNQFASPTKIRKKDPSDDSNRAKKILKEKSSSENVILSSTPIRNSNGKWGKFRSLHPEKFEIGKSLDEVEPFEKVLTNISKSTDALFNFGASFDITNSFELSSNVEQSVHIPSDVHQLLTQEINIQSVAKPVSGPNETITKSQDKNDSAASRTTSNISSSSRTYYHCGRLKMDILGKLHEMDNLALKKILGHLSDIDLLSISHVSQNYKQMIKSDKKLNLKRQSYLKAKRKNQENQTPDEQIPIIVKTAKPVDVEKQHIKRPFEESNINHSMQLRSKAQSPPVSPSRKRFHENQKVAQSHKGFLKKCPRCLRPAKITIIKIRSSPRKNKKKLNIMKISAGSGRIHKTFLSKPSIDSLCMNDQLYATFPGFDEHSSSSCSSPGSPSSDESCVSSNEISNEADIYEYGICSGISCNFKFCVKCNCKYHPRQSCKELAPASPSRSLNVNKSVACSSQSLKSLKRLIY